MPIAVGYFGRYTVLRRISPLRTDLTRLVTLAAFLMRTLSDQPQIIDDDTIRCPMPKQVALGYLIYPEFRLHCLGYAKLASAIMSMLKTSNLARFSATELAETIHMLDTQFATWRDSLPRFARPSKDHNLQDIPTNWNPQLAEYLRCACHALVLSIHSTLAHPWIVESLCPCICRRLTDQIQRSTMLVAELSREVIMTSNSMDITASTPSW